MQVADKVKNLMQHDSPKAGGEGTGLRRCFVTPSPPRPLTPSPKDGFTLVELLVVITIMVILLALTVTAVNFTLDTERIRAGARQVQSYLEGARDRAIYARQPRGVRFLVDPQNPRTVTSMIYIGPTETAKGLITAIYVDGPDADTIPDAPASLIRQIPQPDTIDWLSLHRRALLLTGSKMRIRTSSGQGYPYPVDVTPLYGPDGQPGAAGTDDDGDGNTDFFDLNTNGTQDAGEEFDFKEAGWGGGDDVLELQLLVPLRDPGQNPPSATNDVAFASIEYELQLPPQPVADEQPVLLPQGIVIDLDGSRVPDAWRPASGAPFAATYSTKMDVMFSPRGTAMGPTASTGLMHFYLSEAADADAMGLFVGRTINQGDTPLVPREELQYGTPPETIRDRLLVSLFTQTGSVYSHPVNGVDAVDNSTQMPPGDGWADTPYSFAIEGEVAGQ